MFFLAETRNLCGPYLPQYHIKFLSCDLIAIWPNVVFEKKSDETKSPKMDKVKWDIQKLDIGLADPLSHTHGPEQNPFGCIPYI